MLATYIYLRSWADVNLGKIRCDWKILTDVSSEENLAEIMANQMLWCFMYRLWS